MKIVARYLPVILLCLSTTPCFSALKQDTNSQSLISFRDFSQQMPKSNCRMSAVDGLVLKKKKSFKELKLKKREYGYSIDEYNSFLAMEISPSKETAGQIRWVAPKPVSGSEVKSIVLYLQKHNQSIHINTGGHGGKDGTTVFDDPSKADMGFIKEDIQTIWNTPNVSFSVMNTYVPSIYPKGANHVIDAWCYSLCTSIKVSLPHFSKESKDEALIAVAANNCPKTVKYIISWFNNLFFKQNSSDKGKDEALKFAAAHGHLEVVKKFRSYTSWEVKNEALKIAAAHGHLEVVKYLIFAFTTQNGKDGALENAAYNGHLDIVKVLLPRVNDLDYKNGALRGAACKGHLEVVKYLLPHASEEGKNRALRDAACKGQLEVVKELFPHASQDGKDGALRDAAKNGYLEVVKYLFRHASQDGKNLALVYAAGCGHLEVVKYLLPHVNDLDYKNVALVYATENGHLEIVKELLPYTLQWVKNKALKVVAKNGHLEVVKVLKNAGAK